MLRHDHVVVLLVGQRIARAPGGDVLPPALGVGLLRFGLEDLQDVAEHIGAIADDRHIDANVLVDRGRIDVDMDLLRIRRERIGAAGDTIVEARADAQHDVAVMHRHVGFVSAVHAEHAQPVRTGGRIGTEAHQRRGDREAGDLDQLTQQPGCRRAGIDDAAAGIDDGLLGIRQQRDGLADRMRIALQARRIGDMDVRLARRMVSAGGELHVLRNVDDDRAGTAGGGDIEGFMQHLGEIVDVADQPVVLGAWPRDADGVAFLEGVIADQMGRHLARDADQRDRIHQCVGQRRDHVGGAGTGGDQHDPRQTGGAGIAFGRVARALLVADQDVLNLLLLEDLVIDRQHGAAGIAEQMLHAVIRERAHDHGSAGHLVGQISRILGLCVTHGRLRMRPWRFGR